MWWKMHDRISKSPGESVHRGDHDVKVTSSKHVTITIPTVEKFSVLIIVQCIILVLLIFIPMQPI